MGNLSSAASGLPMVAVQLQTASAAACAARREKVCDCQPDPHPGPTPVRSWAPRARCQPNSCAASTEANPSAPNSTLPPSGDHGSRPFHRVESRERPMSYGMRLLPKATSDDTTRAVFLKRDRQDMPVSSAAVYGSQIGQQGSFGTTICRLGRPCSILAWAWHIPDSPSATR